MHAEWQGTAWVVEPRHCECNDGLHRGLDASSCKTCSSPKIQDPIPSASAFPHTHPERNRGDPNTPKHLYREKTFPAKNDAGITVVVPVEKHTVGDKVRVGLEIGCPEVAHSRGWETRPATPPRYLLSP